MSSSGLAIPIAPPAAAIASLQTSAAPRHLFSPWLDFLCLGGSSLVLMPLFVLLPTAEENRMGMAGMMMLLAVLINQPHFAHSYQIFYRDFVAKAFGADRAVGLRLRYILAGLAIPALLTLFFAACLWREDARLLGYAGNLMGLLVGWHYVKQGYGML